MSSEDIKAYEVFMEAALEQGAAAEAAGDVPVGAVVVCDGRIIASAHNRRIIDSDPTAHAEMLAIRAAAERIGDWRLSGCTLFVTLEPCCMCAGAIILARLDRLVYGTPDPKGGAVETLYRICDDPRLNHRVEVVSGVKSDRCAALLSRFFQKQRDMGKK